MPQSLHLTLKRRYRRGSVEGLFRFLCFLSAGLRFWLDGVSIPKKDSEEQQGLC